MITTPLPNLLDDIGKGSKPDRNTLAPMVAIGGSQGKSTIAWLLIEIARASGANVGSWLSSGVYVNDELLAGELGAWKRVLLGARAGELELVVQEMNAPTVVGVGLPASTYQAAVITNICGNDSLCQHTKIAQRQYAAGKEILSALKNDGVIIGNADDPAVVSLIEEFPNNRLLFALHHENPVLVNHLDEGGTGAWIHEDEVMYGSLDSAVAIAHLDELYAPVGGSLMFQIQNILAAICLSGTLGYPLAGILATVSKFSPDISRQPGACNIFEYFDSRIIVDSAPRAWPLKMLMRGIRRQPHRRTLVVAGVFPDMPLEEIREIGRIIGSLAGVVIIHANSDQAARRELLKAGLADSAALPIVIEATNEIEAVDRMLNLLQRYDSGLVLAEDTSLVLEKLYPAPNVSVHS